MFNAAVELDGKGATFRPGMSAVMEVLLEEPRPRLVIPREAVQESDEGPVVLRKTRSGSERVPIQGSVFDDRYFLVTEGLQENDVILVRQETEMAS